MAHFAQIDENSVVNNVIVVNNIELLVNGIESEDKGKEFCQSLFGGNWLQTSYNGKIRYNFAGVGFTYDPIDDAFIAPAPCNHKELILNAKKQWECTECEAERDKSMAL